MNEQHIMYLMALRSEIRQHAEAYAQRNMDKEVMLQRQYEMALSAGITALEKEVAAAATRAIQERQL